MTMANLVLTESEMQREQNQDRFDICGISCAQEHGFGMLPIQHGNHASCPELLSHDPSVPEILWIGCSEALLLPHRLLNLSRGQILVHRNFGNCAPAQDLNFLSVLEFALETLNIRHIIVAGHYDCRAVKAVLADNRTGLLHHWLAPMNEMLILRRKEVSAMIRPQDQEAFLATLHAGYQVRNLADNPAVRKYWAKGQELNIHGWVYRDGTDQLYDLGISLSSPQQ